MDFSNKINLTFISNNKTLHIDSNLYKLLSVEGLESADIDISTSKNTSYDGETILRKSINSRVISITGEFIGKLNKIAHRQELITFFNPKIEGTLIINYGGIERAINYEVEAFKCPIVNVNDPLKFMVDLYCPKPYLNTKVTLGEQISTWIGGLKFKFRLPFKLKQKGEPRQNIYNDGHVETPVEIVFRGPAVNPSVINHTTGEFMKVNRTLTSNDTLYINTEEGNKKIEIIRNEVQENASNYIDLDSTYFNLQVGDNLIEYTTENDLDPQSVEIRYRNRYLGV